MGMTFLAYNSATDSAWVIVPPIIFCLLYFLVYRKIIMWLRQKLLRKYLHSQQMDKQNCVMKYNGLSKKADERKKN